MRRPIGAGSLYYCESRTAWVADIAIPTPKGAKRRRRLISRKLFCATLRALSDAHPRPLEVASRDGMSRNGLMRLARDRGTHTLAEWIAHVREVGRHCEYCGARVSTRLGNWTKDHKTPVTRGGSDAIDNLALCCLSCNASKGSRTLAEFEAWRTAA